MVCSVGFLIPPRTPYPAHCKLDFSTSILVQGNAPQTWLQPDLIEATLQLRFPFQDKAELYHADKLTRARSSILMKENIQLDGDVFYTKAISTMIAFNVLIEQDTHYNWTWKWERCIYAAAFRESRWVRENLTGLWKMGKNKNIFIECLLNIRHNTNYFGGFKEL